MSYSLTNPPTNPPLEMSVRANPGATPETNTSMDAYHFSVGSILGDGSLHLTRSYLTIGNKSPSFVLWKKGLAAKAGLLGNTSTSSVVLNRGMFINNPVSLPLSYRGVYVNNGRLDPVTSQRRSALRRQFFITTRRWYGKGWREAFYKQDPTTGLWRKAIPQNINELFFGDLALAVWFLDDGWVQADESRYNFACGEWTPEECDLMVNCLQTNFNIKARWYASRGTPHQFRIARESEAEFNRRVGPYYLDFKANFRGHRTSKAMRNKYLFTFTRRPGQRKVVKFYNTDILFPDRMHEFWSN